MKLFCSTQACTNLSNNMQMKNNTVSNMELSNELATAFLSLRREEKRKKTDSSGGSGATRSQVLGAQKVDCYLSSLSYSQGREDISPRQQRKKDVAPAD